jgi:hypothetical protein
MSGGAAEEVAEMHTLLSSALPAGAVTGIGSVSHLSADVAAAFSLSSCPALPFVPQLVHRHPAEGMIAQVLLGLPGVELAGDLLQVDLAKFDAKADVRIDLSGQAFVSLRTFLRVARGHRGAVKWQLTGPLTIGMALLHFGVPVSDAFHVALRVVRATARAIHAQVAQDLPGCTQVVFIDEPSAGAVLTPGFPLSPDDAIDLVSGAMAVLEDVAVMGLHCCAHADLAALLAAGPAIVSVPAEASVAGLSGYLAPFLDGGGIVAWGVVPTDRPLALHADRYWHELSTLWSELVVGGCDPGQLRRQSIITPACGLAGHTPEQAAHVFALTNAVAAHVAEQAASIRLTARA